MNKATSTQTSFWPFFVGVLLLLVALSLQVVTLAGGSYAPILLSALLLVALADACFVYSFLRAGIIVRFLSVFCLLPTLFILFDFVRRAPYVFTH